MSVAFRRESDEEHLEPRFERPIPPGPNLVTRRGLALIAQAIDDMRATLEDAVGDVRIAELKRDLRYWQARQASARPTPPTPGEEAGFGSCIRYRPKDGQPVTIRIVGQDEADPAQGLIAFTAPLARVLIGAGPGDTVAFAGVADAIEIIEVAPGEVPSIDE